MVSTRTTVARLKKLLLQRDLDAIMQGVELTVSLDDEAVWDFLLEGVTTRTHKGFTYLVPNKIFKTSSVGQGWHDLALHLLVAYSSSTLKEEITEITLRDGNTREAPSLRLNLKGFSLFRNLQKLEICRAAYVDAKELQHCLRLTHLDIDDAVLENFVAPPALQEVELEECSFDLSVFSASKNLKKVRIKDMKVELTPLVDVDSLEKVGIYFSEVSLFELAGSAIKELKVNGKGTQKIHNLPELRDLELYGKFKIVSIEDCNKLEEVLLRGGDVDLRIENCANISKFSLDRVSVNCGPLASLGSLKELFCTEVVTSYEDLAGSSLEKLVIRNRRNDPATIVGLQNIRHVDVKAFSIDMPDILKCKDLETLSLEISSSGECPVDLESVSKLTNIRSLVVTNIPVDLLKWNAVKRSR